MYSEEKNENIFTIETDYGNIEVRLYEDTPLHKENFVKLVKEDFYDGLLFHRVIKDFMIQGGNPETRISGREKGQVDEKPDYTVPAEFVYPKYYHKKGALAAARTADSVNPEKASSSSQFYIVTGNVFTDEDLDRMEKQRFERLKSNIFQQLQQGYNDSIKEFYRKGEKEKLAELRESLIEKTEELAESKKAGILFNDLQRKDYKTVGGAPHLDGEYTVFGEVVSGMEVIDKIQSLPTDPSDKPVENISFNIKIKTEEL